MKTLKIFSLFFGLMINNWIFVGDMKSNWIDAAAGATLIGLGTYPVYTGTKTLNYMHKRPWARLRGSYPLSHKLPFMGMAGTGIASMAYGTKLLYEYYNSNISDNYYPTKRR